jgi:hypothetical protein
MKVKKIIIGVSALCLMIFALASCGGGSGSSKSKSLSKPAEPWVDITIVTQETVVPATDVCPEYTILEKTQYDLSKFAMDEEGFYVLFDGKTLNGWRGYSRDDVPGRWTVDQAESAIKFSGSGTGEEQDGASGGDLLFGRKFKNFELSMEWKVSQAGNSGIFYLGQEIKGQPAYISAPECQVLDNENHIDGRTAKTASSSLYDMIAADPQNSKPFGQWNSVSIIVDRGNVYHFQNGEKVVAYNLWTPKWTEMLQASKFSRERWPIAFELLNNCGGTNREGYIVLQDHGDDVWFRNIRIKILN